MCHCTFCKLHVLSAAVLQEKNRRISFILNSITLLDIYQILNTFVCVYYAFIGSNYECADFKVFCPFG